MNSATAWTLETFYKGGQLDAAEQPQVTQVSKLPKSRKATNDNVSNGNI